MPRKEQGWITFQSSEEERQILEEYCQQSQRTKTDILRELVRSLGEEKSLLNRQKPASVTILTDDADLRGMKLSARNVLKGRIQRIVMGPVDTEILIAIAPEVEIISLITTASAENLGLRVKQSVYAVIKSTSVTIESI
jgi:molybdopterin-binding protein